MKKIIMSLIMAVAVAGCASTTEKNPLAGKNFINETEGIRITLNFEAKDLRLSGKVVNTYSAPYELAGDNIIVGRMASTMMMPLGVSAQIERDYFDFMSDKSPKHYILERGILTLTNHEGKSYKFERI